MYQKWENKKRLQTNLCLACCVSFSCFLSDQLAYSSLPITNNITEDVPLGRKRAGEKTTTFSSILPMTGCTSVPSSTQQIWGFCYMASPTICCTFPLPSLLLSNVQLLPEEGVNALFADIHLRKNAEARSMQNMSLFPQLFNCYIFKETYYPKLKQRIK